MLKRLTGWFVLIPLCLILVIFALANRQTVTIHLDPLSLENPLIGPFEVPMYFVIYGTLLFGVLIGGIASWFSAGRVRRERRQFRKQAHQLENEIKNQQAQRAGSMAQLEP